MREPSLGGNMRKKIGRLITTQRTSEVTGTPQSYDQWLALHAPKDETGEPMECPQANPDVLTEDDAMYADSQPTAAQFLMGDAIEHLQGRQREVYLLVMREGFSLDQAGKKLGISKWTARDYKDRAIKFISQYCRRHMDKHENA